MGSWPCTWSLTWLTLAAGGAGRQEGPILNERFRAAPQWTTSSRLLKLGKPTLHATGIPLDYRLPVERFQEGDPIFDKFLVYYIRFGNNLVPAFPDTPDLTVAERLEKDGEHHLVLFFDLKPQVELVVTLRESSR